MKYTVTFNSIDDLKELQGYPDWEGTDEAFLEYLREMWTKYDVRATIEPVKEN